MTTILPKGRTQFADANGAPLAGGSVAFYVPGTTTPKDTWQDSGQVTLNTNPVTLDSAGSALIFGSGAYRQVVKDVAGNTIFDAVTDSPATESKVQSGALLVAGSVAGSNAITGTLSPAPASLADGEIVRWKTVLANTAAVTVNWNGLGAVSLLKPGSAGPIALVGGELQPAQWCEAAYDATNARFVLTSPGMAPATKALMISATDTVTAVTPALVQNHAGVAKAWGHVGSGGGLSVAYGISSVTKTGTGAYTVNFTTAFTSADFAVMGILDLSAGIIVVTARAVGSCSINTRDLTSTNIDAAFDIVFFGTQ